MSVCPTSAPHEEYTRRLGERRTRQARLQRAERTISNSRMVVFLAGVGLAWLAFDARLISAGWLVVPVVVFAGLVVMHERVIRARGRADRCVAFYVRGMARLEGRWMDGGVRGDRFLDAAHPNAADLDLFGRGSLFELLCTARTHAGEEILAGWLRAPAVPEEIRARQGAVAELQPHLDLREALALTGEDVRAGLEPEALAAWGEEPSMNAGRSVRAICGLLGALAVGLLGAWLAGLTGAQLPLAVCAAEAALALRLRGRVRRVLRRVPRAGRDLGLLAELLARVENVRFTSLRLVALRAALAVDGEPPSRSIARLHRLMHLLDARKNQIFAPLSAPLLWTTQLTLAIEAWRARHGRAIRGWLAAVGEIEALCAFAGYAYEHPDDPFPEIVATARCFEAEGLGHPLIPTARCVRNDVHLDDELRLLVVSGSNMSGKSTLLRTVGVNAVLALAGAPVCARRLRLAPLVVGASIRIQDSLQGGTSRFYAEITRLRQLMDLTRGNLPLLFLLDEILHGTNSHDRGIGAEAVLRGLVARDAIGLVTTHDLALTRVADALAPQAANVHFEDHLENGRMHFDYRMRPGVVTKSNALALMRAVGLEV